MLVIAAVGLLGLAKSHGSAPSPTNVAHAHVASAAPTYAVAAAIFALGALFAIAWWDTRKPAATLSVWALAASALNVAQGVFLGWLSHLTAASRIRFSPADGIFFVVAGVAGLFIFSRRQAPSDPALAMPIAISVPGDRTSAATRHAVTALSTVAQIVALVFWSRLAYTQHLLRHHGLSWIVLTTAACILATVIHESGHAILAWCFEMKLLSFKAGPFHWASREGTWSFRFHAVGLVTPGGCISAAPAPDQAPWELILMIAAGPGANLLFGAACTWAVIHDRWNTYQQTWEFLAYTGAFCLIGAALNLIPFRSEEGSYSDGARILQIATGSPLAFAASVPSLAAEEAPEPLAAAQPVLVPEPALLPKPMSVPEPAVVAPALFTPSTPVSTPQAVAAPLAVAEPVNLPVAEVISSPTPPLPAMAESTSTPVTSRTLEPVTIAAAKPASAPPPVPPVREVIRTEQASSKPVTVTDELLAARLASFLARPTRPPAAVVPEPPPVVRTPAPTVAAAPIATVKESNAPAVPQIVFPAAEILSDPIAAAIRASAAVALTSPAVAAKANATPGITASAPGPLAETFPAVALPPDQSKSAGLLASVTRIPTSAFDASPKPLSIRLASSELASSSTPAPGSKAPSVPSAFARRPRPEPLSSGGPGIEEILAAAAATTGDRLNVNSVKVEEPVAVASTILEPAAPTAAPLVAPASDPAPLALTFSEAWPPRPTTVPSPTQFESQAPTPATSAAPTTRLCALAEDPPIEESPALLPETPRFDAFEFLRNAARESLNASAN